MSLDPRLERMWRRRCADRRMESGLTLSDDGLWLGVTKLARFCNEELAIDEPRLLALLSVTYLEPVFPQAMDYIRSAAKAYRSRDAIIASMHLALTGIKKLQSLEQAQQLFIAEHYLRIGIKPVQLLKWAGFDAVSHHESVQTLYKAVGKFNPNHLGPGPGGGQFTTAALDGTSNGLPPGSGKPNRSTALKPASYASARGTQVAEDDSEFMRDYTIEGDGVIPTPDGEEDKPVQTVNLNPYILPALMVGAAMIPGGAEVDALELAEEGTGAVIDANALNAEQAANLLRFEKNLPVNADSTKVIDLANGNKIFQSDVPAQDIPNSFARYEKTVDSAGNTIKFTKTTYAPDGSIVHTKVKFEIMP